MAVGKYVKQYKENGKTNDTAKAIDLLVKEHVMLGVQANPLSTHDTDAYRSARIYVEDVDDVLAANLKTLEHIFQKFAPKSVEKGMMRKETEMSEKMKRWKEFSAALEKWDTAEVSSLLEEAKQKSLPDEGAMSVQPKIDPTGTAKEPEPDEDASIWRPGPASAHGVSEEQ